MLICFTDNLGARCQVLFARVTHRLYSQKGSVTNQLKYVAFCVKLKPISAEHFHSVVYEYDPSKCIVGALQPVTITATLCLPFCFMVIKCK